MVVNECPEGEVLKKIEEYCVPTDKDVTHATVIHAPFDSFVPICGRRTPCPRKEGDCPPGFLDGKIEGYCGSPPICDGPGQPLCTDLHHFFPPPDPNSINTAVLVTLVG